MPSSSLTGLIAFEDRADHEIINLDTKVRPTTWTILPHDGPNHLGL